MKLLSKSFSWPACIALEPMVKSNPFVSSLRHGILSQQQKRNKYTSMKFSPGHTISCKWTEVWNLKGLAYHLNSSNFCPRGFTAVNRIKRGIIILEQTWCLPVFLSRINNLLELNVSMLAEDLTKWFIFRYSLVLFFSNSQSLLLYSKAFIDLLHTKILLLYKDYHNLQNFATLTIFRELL